MNYEINASFARVDHILPFIHLTSTILLVSAQMALVMVTVFFSKKIYADFFRYVKFTVISFFILLFIIVVSGYLLSNGGDFKFSDPMIEGIINTKFGLSLLIACNLLYITQRFYMAKKAYKNSDTDEMNEHIIIAVRYFIILDIVLLFIAVYLGVALWRFS